MTEKSYGGNNGVREHLGKPMKVKSDSKSMNNKKSKQASKSQSSSSSTDTDDNNNNKKLNEEESYKKAGEIAKKVIIFAKDLIKPNMSLLEIAQKIDAEIIKLGAQPAFPVNLSIDDIAAHYHPTLDDKTLATGLLKVDIGIHINGFIADTAFSLDLTPDKKHKELIKASEEALESALAILKNNPSLNDIGQAIQEAIEKKGFSPIINLCGHGLANYDIHSGITLPNYANNNTNKLEPGAYAIEPFATTGQGKIYEGQGSNIYKISNLKNPRGPTARKILDYIWGKNQTLPFSLRELQEKFGPMTKLAMKELEQLGIVHHYPQLIEISHKPVSQAEHTFIKTKKGEIIITTK